jgi:hypothetical protein
VSEPPELGADGGQHPEVGILERDAGIFSQSRVLLKVPGKPQEIYSMPSQHKGRPQKGMLPWRVTVESQVRGHEDTSLNVRASLATIPRGRCAQAQFATDPRSKALDVGVGRRAPLRQARQQDRISRGPRRWCRADRVDCFAGRIATDRIVGHGRNSLPVGPRPIPNFISLDDIFKSMNFEPSSPDA